MTNGADRRVGANNPHMRDRIAAALYQAVLDGNSGYVEGQESGVKVDPTDPDDSVTVDSQICFPDLADAVIKALRPDWIVVRRDSAAGRVLQRHGLDRR